VLRTSVWRTTLLLEDVLRRWLGSRSAVAVEVAVVEAVVAVVVEAVAAIVAAGVAGTLTCLGGREHAASYLIFLRFCLRINGGGCDPG